MKRAILLLWVILLAGCAPAAPTAAINPATPLSQPSATGTLVATLTSTPSPGPTKTLEVETTATPRPTRTPFMTYTALPTGTAGLRQLATARGIDIGAAVAVDPLMKETQYQAVLAREFSLVTAENAMKFGETEPQRGVYDFSGADTIVEFALHHGMRVRGHTFVWHQALPDWLTSGTWTREELIKILQDHIAAEAGHFKGKVFAWDVVNEAMDDSNSIWLNGIGPDYVEIAFRAARQADPDALLFYNDYGAEGMNGKSDVVYDLVKGLKEKGLVDGVGLQMHLTDPGGLTRAELEENMRRLGELGLIVHITELDVRLAMPPTQAQLENQARLYGDVFQACVSVSACKAVVMWGFTDLHSWVPSTYRNFGAALPFDENYLPKPAYHAILEALGN
jgi:endo-1,4-beta-xylanase